MEVNTPVQAAGTIRLHRFVSLAISALVAITATGCAQDSPNLTAGTTTVTTAAASCERPRVTGTADALHYPANLDEMVGESDVVIEGRIVGDAGPANENSQPMTVTVEVAYKGDAAARVTVQRNQTHYPVNGTPGTLVGSWAGEPWYCPSERYMLFLTRSAEGTYQALTRLGAIPIEPRPSDETLATWQPPEPLRSLVLLDADTLRSQVRASANRASH